MRSQAATRLRLDGDTLVCDQRPLLAGIAPTVEAISDAPTTGLFLRLTVPAAAALIERSLGRLHGIRRFTACHRYEPFWMHAAAGQTAAEIPAETQVLLAERDDGTCVLFVPLIDEPMRAALYGRGNTLCIRLESGDPAATARTSTALFVAAGDDPYTLLDASAAAVMQHLGTGRLRRDKTLPAWVDTFGWCTWDAFYQEVSHERVRSGLESFQALGVQPRTLILDDGWQSEQPEAGGARRLTAFAANAKFPGGLRETVRMAKGQFGVDTVIVWHTMNGYWGGVDGAAMPDYPVRVAQRSYGPGVVQHVPTLNAWWGGTVGVVSPGAIDRFFHDYHRALRREGVDGVKVDSQATLEGVAAGDGGRVTLMRRYREALEGAAQVHFQGNLINCMSCSNEMLYSALSTSLTRTSTDFWPLRPETHGIHLYDNAQVSAWFGAFVHPDWDMFQSGHPMGAFHAAGRAVSGGPVYVSDTPGEHDAALLRTLVLPDGRVLRARLPGRPTRDCLFANPTRDDQLLKIFSLNAASGVLGAFHARYRAEGNTAIAGAISPGDVHGLAGERFAVYAHQARELRLMARDERWELELAPHSWELFTIVPITSGIAPIGLADMLNAGGAVRAMLTEPGQVRLDVWGGGRFLAWCAQPPTVVMLDGHATDYRCAEGLLELDVPVGDHRITLASS